MKLRHFRSGAHAGWLLAAVLSACSQGPRLQVSVLDNTGSVAIGIRDATVQLRDGGAPVTKSTGSSGRTHFSDLEEGTYELVVEKSGYSSTRATVQFPEQKSLELLIHQVFTVTGQVLFPDGSPVQDAVVYFIAPDQNERIAAQMSGSRYRFEELPPAIYQVQAGTRDHLYSLVLDKLIIQGETQKDLILSEMPPQFEMPTDEPQSLPAPASRGQLPKQ